MTSFDFGPLLAQGLPPPGKGLIEQRRRKRPVEIVRKRGAEVGATTRTRSRRYCHPLAVMIVDIDHFKAVNDRFGHDAGDNVLKAVADVCRSTKRGSDTLARIGGEEFALLLPETYEAAALIAAKRCVALSDAMGPIGDRSSRNPPEACGHLQAVSNRGSQ